MLNNIIYCEAEKKEPISLVCMFFNTSQKLVIFFTYIKDSIDYNSVYLNLACINIFVQ